MDAMMGGKMRPSLHIEPAQLGRTVEAVCNAILKWALDLERQGISGEGL